MSYYMRLVEHFFALAVRSPFIRNEASARWYKDTTHWIEKQSLQDKILLHRTYSRDKIAVTPADFDRIKTLAAQFAKDMQLA